MDVLRALAICGGAARRPAVARLGVDDAALRRAVRAGVLQPDRGLYALPAAAPDHVGLRERLPGKRNGRARQVLDWVDRGAESMPETLARTYFRQAGISVETQVHIDGVGYVDLLLEGRLIVELDGRHHGEWAPVKKDQRRNNVSAVRGYSVLRYYYDDVVHHPALMVAEALAVLAGTNVQG